MNNKYVRKYSIGIEDKGTYIFPFLSSFSITDTSQLSTYPLVTKEKVSDHMFNDSKKVTLAGSLSNFGINTEKNKHYNSYEFTYPYYDNEKNTIIFKKSHSTNSSYLIRMYQFFDALKKNNVILKVKSPSLIFKNCVIDSLSWNESFNNADFTLSLSQIKTYTGDDVVIKDIAPDPNLPIISDPVPQSFIESTLLKERQVVEKYIYEYFKKIGIVDESFDKYILQAVAAGVVTYLGVWAVVGIVALAVLFLSSNPVGWILIVILAVIAAIAGIAYGLYKIITRTIQRRKIWKKYGMIFDGYKNKKKMKKSIETYDKYMNYIFDALKSLDKVFNTYEISQNIKQDLLIDLGGEYFILRFLKQKENESWKVSVLKNDETSINNYEQIDLIVSENINKGNSYVIFFQLKNKNCFFENKKEKLYFLYKKNDVKENRVFDLTKLKIVTSKFDMDKIQDSVGQIAVETLKRRDV